MKDGIIIVVLTLESGSGRVLAGPDIVSRGFVYVRGAEDLMDSARAVLNDTMDRLQDKNITDWTKIKNEIKRTEERMALIEAEIEELDNMYADPAISSDTAKLMEIHTRKEALSKELDELYDKWGELTL